VLIESRWLSGRKGSGRLSEEKKSEHVVPTRPNRTHSSHFLSSYLKVILHRDRRLYGVEPATAIATAPNNTAASDEPLIQQRIEDLVEVPGGSTEFRGPQNALDT
jgi:hypothetical protein